MEANLKAWIQAARLRTLPLAASCVLTGSAFALKHGGFNSVVFVLILITTFMLQVLSNLANDYGDSQNGADNDLRVGPARAVQSGAISARRMRKAVVVVAVSCLVSGVSLLWTVFRFEQIPYVGILFFILGLIAIAAAIKYTAGKNPYGYSGFGDLSVMIFFGFLGVMGTFYLHCKEFDATLIWPSLTIGALSTAVLNLNNLRDHISDSTTGKRTLVVRIGFSKGKYYHIFLISMALISAVVTVFHLGGKSSLALLVLIIPLTQCVKVARSVNGSDLDSELKKTALSAFLFSLLLFILN